METSSAHRGRTRYLLGILLLTTALASTSLYAHDGLSEASSELSALPVALSVAAPILLVSGTATLVVASVEATALGVTWVLKTSANGSRHVLQFTAGSAVAASMVIGSAVHVTTNASGLLLSCDGKVVAIIPNPQGQRLNHHERLS